MLFKPLAFAASAAAFLIVPDVTKPTEDSAKDGVFEALPVQAEPFNLPAAAMAQSLDVPCQQCKGKNSNLRFDFDVVDGTRLMLNGFELYPSADPWHGDLVASVSMGDGKEKDQMLGYALAVLPEGMDEVQQMEVVSVELRVIEVGSRFVDGIPAVKVKLIKAATGEILIGNVEIKEISETECDSMWCRTKDVFGGLFKGLKGFKGGFKGIKGCAGGRHKSHKSHKGSQAHGGHKSAGVVGAHREQNGHHRHHGKEHHRHHHRWSKLFKNVVIHIFLPVLMGVAAGVGVAIFAMFVCTSVVRLTTLVKGKRGESWCARRHAARVEVVDEEKSGLMEDQEAPPQYEDDIVKN